jgi:hypothetical protein
MDNQPEMELVFCTECKREEIAAATEPCRHCKQGALCVECQKAGGICSACDCAIDTLRGHQDNPVSKYITDAQYGHGQTQPCTGDCDECSLNRCPGAQKCVCGSNECMSQAMMAAESRIEQLESQLAHCYIDHDARLSELESVVSKCQSLVSAWRNDSANIRRLNNDSEVALTIDDRADELEEVITHD